MYSAQLNKRLEMSYADLSPLTQRFSDFFTHLSYLTLSPESNMNCDDSHDIDLAIWKERIKRITTIEEVKITFIVVCKNEERCIERCLNSIRSETAGIDEIIVIDSGSVDNTLEIIKDNFTTVRLIETVWENDFSKLRNFGIKQANNNWIFFIDADETLQEGSVKNLRNYLQIIEWYDLRPIIISPTILNSNGHIIHEVRRIFRKDSGVQYYGLIHEEPRKDIGAMGEDLLFASFNNILLTHDGYQKENIYVKNKVHRNVDLLKRMIVLEPLHPRWKYFLGRDGMDIISMEQYEDLLQESISLCGTKPIFFRYKVRALSDLTGFYIDHIRLEDAQESLKKLEELKPDLSDIIYYKYFIKLVEYKKNSFNLIRELIHFRNSRESIEYGSIHSNYYHIDFLISKFLFEVGEYEESFSVLDNLEERKYGNFSYLYEKLHSSLLSYMNRSLNK